MSACSSKEIRSKICAFKPVMQRRSLLPCQQGRRDTWEWSIPVEWWTRRPWIVPFLSFVSLLLQIRRKSEKHYSHGEEDDKPENTEPSRLGEGRISHAGHCRPGREIDQDRRYLQHHSLLNSAMSSGEEKCGGSRRFSRASSLSPGQFPLDFIPFVSARGKERSQGVGNPQFSWSNFAYFFHKKTVQFIDRNKWTLLESLRGTHYSVPELQFTGPQFLVFHRVYVSSIVTASPHWCLTSVANNKYGKLTKSVGEFRRTKNADENGKKKLR